MNRFPLNGIETIAGIATIASTVIGTGMGVYSSIKQSKAQKKQSSSLSPLTQSKSPSVAQKLNMRDSVLGTSSQGILEAPLVGRSRLLS